MKSYALRSAALLCLILAFLGLQAQTQYHHLIAGSFDNLPAASQLAEALQARGQNATILFPSASSAQYRVSVYASTSKPEVEAYSAALRNAGAKQYWILTLSDYSSSQAAQRSSGTQAKGSKAPAPAAGTKLFHVVVSSHNNISEATIRMQSLASEGYEPYLLYPSVDGEPFRVGVFRSANRKEAQAYLSMHKRKKGSGWLYEAPMPGTSGSAVSMPAGPGLPPGKAAAASTTFHVIAGSYSRFDQASAFADAMKAKGLQPLILFPEPGKPQTFRVSVYRSIDRASADAFKQSSGMSSAWILAQ
jgi:hypothetical protein